MFNNNYDIPIWVERALLSKLSASAVLITAKTGLLKGLKIAIKVRTEKKKACS
jgi:hypothetical protein